MQEHIKSLLTKAISELKSSGQITNVSDFEVQISRTKDKSHGDFASNIALKLSKLASMPAPELANRIVANISSDTAITKIEIAGPGFLNFYINDDYQTDVLNVILTA